MEPKGRKPFSVEFFKAAEEISGPLSEHHRDAIRDATEHYRMCIEYHLDSRKSPAVVQGELEALATAAGELAKQMKSLSREALLALYEQPGANHIVRDRHAFAKSLAGLQSAVASAIETSIRGRWSVLEAAFFGREKPYQVPVKGRGRPSETLRELFFVDLLRVCEKPQIVEKILPLFVAHGILRRGEVPWGDAARKAIKQAQKSALNPKNQTSTTSRQ